MPISFNLSATPPHYVNLEGTASQHNVGNAQQNVEVLAARMSNISGTADVRPLGKGFVWTALDCYKKHHNFLFRPDDVWMAILTQLNLFFHFRGSSMRKDFVSWEGRLPARGSHAGSIDSIDWEAQIEDAMTTSSYIVPGFRQMEDCLIPDFTTTATSDKTSAKIALIGKLSKFFDYGCHIRCAIPAVVVRGTKDDYLSILARIDKLSQVEGFLQSEILVRWFYWIRPVIQRIVWTFDNPHSPTSVAFWQNMIHGRVREDKSFSGWITVFCVFDERGHDKLFMPDDPRAISSNRSSSDPSPDYRFFYSDGYNYPTISIDNIPPCLAAVPFPLKVDVGGIVQDLNVWLFAGHVGTTPASPSDLVALPEVANAFSSCTLKPVIGWFVVFSPEAAVSGRPPSMNGVHIGRCHTSRPPNANVIVNRTHYAMGSSVQMQSGSIQFKRVFW